MDDIVGELRDCAADSQECGYRSRAQVAMLRAADDIVALQGRINRQCQSVNELVAATEKCIAERDALRAMVAELERTLADMVSIAESSDWDNATTGRRIVLADARRLLSAGGGHSHKPTCKECGQFLDARGKCRVPEHNV